MNESQAVKWFKIISGFVELTNTIAIAINARPDDPALRFRSPVERPSMDMTSPGSGKASEPGTPTRCGTKASTAPRGRRRGV